ncbi:MAG: metallophosphoesterase family protein [Oscillospiraceae bacterium]
MELYITGDTHGDFSRFRPESFYEQERLTKEDVILVAGDFGGVWYGDSRDDAGLNFLDSRPFTTAFVSGNHENYDALAAYPQAEWHGGRVRTIRPSVLMLERGQVFDLGAGHSSLWAVPAATTSRTAFWSRTRRTSCGGSSGSNAQGAAFRVNHRSWWREELPSESEYAEARANLDRAGWTVDYLLTHCGPTSIQNDLLGPLSKPDALTDFLEEIGQRCQFKYHFFGHYHRNEIVRKKCVLLYEQIIRLK